MGSARRRGLAAAGSRLLGGLVYLYPFLEGRAHGPRHPQSGGLTVGLVGWAPRYLLGGLEYLDLFLGGEWQRRGPNISKIRENFRFL